MSRAFVKEPDGDVPEELPERLVSAARNFVTPRGLRLIEAAIERLRAPATPEARRDLRYWLARRSTAEIVPVPPDVETVRFGHRVTLERDDGRRLSYRIVGEDEADPAKGLVSHASPLAAALFGRRVGESVAAGNTEAEIVGIAVE